MKTSASLLACLLLHYTASPLAQIYQVTDSEGHAEFTDQYPEAHQTSVSITAIEKEPVDYQTTDNSSAPTPPVSQSIQQRKAKNALLSHQKQQRYLAWQQQLADKKKEIGRLKAQLDLAKKIQADDFVANAQGGVRLTQAYRDRVSTIHQKLILNEKAWLALRRNKPN